MSESAFTIRLIGPQDVQALENLFADFGHPAPHGAMGSRLRAYLDGGDEGLIAFSGDAAVAAATLHVTPVLHRAASVGRVTALVVAAHHRGAGLGRALMVASEDRLRARGCGSIEVTSNAARVRAHTFYQRLGYELTSVKLVKPLS